MKAVSAIVTAGIVLGVSSTWVAADPPTCPDGQEPVIIWVDDDGGWECTDPIDLGGNDQVDPGTGGGNNSEQDCTAHGDGDDAQSNAHLANRPTRLRNRQGAPDNGKKFRKKSDRPRRPATRPKRPSRPPKRRRR